MSKSPSSHSYISVWSFHLAFGALVIALAACGGGGNSSPTDPTGPPVSTSAQIAVIGCSQTSNAWRGWLEQGDSKVWTLIQGYGGGAVTDWAGGIPNGDYWRRFDTNAAANPPANIVWWELCDRSRRPASIMQAEAIAEEIHRRLPGVTIYATPLAEFERPETCGKQDIANSRRITDHMIMTGAVLRGPELPLVLDAWIQPPQGDGGCHIGADGRAAMGQVLTAFDWRTQ